MAILAAYPDLACFPRDFETLNVWGISEDILCAGKDEVIDWLKELFSEVAELFPGRYVHLGGDEAPKQRWQNCPHCQARIKKQGLAGEEALQKMMDVTTGALFLVALVNPGFTDVYEVIFGETEPEPEYIYLYNVLHQMGYPANVEVMTRNYQIPLEMQLGILRSSYDFTPKLEQRLMEHLAASGRLVERENGAWVKRTYKDGMIWYQKD